ncbi:hypothetical protein ACNT8L_05970 [Brucella intermedia]|uniref:hypothetical protein n=1 Tax=Brucella intermedia TaxID=94625 RepID=UPI003AB82EB4
MLSGPLSPGSGLSEPATGKDHPYEPFTIGRYLGWTGEKPPIVQERFTFLVT